MTEPSITNTAINSSTSISFSSFDKFDRKPFADKLTKTISTFFRFYNDAFVLSLNARFGSGKTTFLRMWQDDLEAQGYTVLYINAWETDFDDEPLIPIISTLLDKIASEKAPEKLKGALKGALSAVALASNSALSQISGVDMIDIMTQVGEDLNGQSAQKVGEAIYKEFAFKERVYKELKIKLLEYVGSLPKQPLIIFVDELDRVRPNYSVKFLEAIKHIFSVQGVCFVLAVDRVQLETSTKQLYGMIDFENYYRRFITREANLPSVTTLDHTSFFGQLASEFFDEKRASGVIFAFEVKDQAGILWYLSTVVRILSFSPREAESLFRVFVQFMAIESPKIGVARWIRASIILIAFSIKNPAIYHRIGQGRISAKELTNMFDDLNLGSSIENHSDERSFLVDTILFLVRQNRASDLNVLVDYFQIFDNRFVERASEVMEADRKRAFQMFSGGPNDHGGTPHKSGFESIYIRLEAWRGFID